MHGALIQEVTRNSRIGILNAVGWGSRYQHGTRFFLSEETPVVFDAFCRTINSIVGDWTAAGKARYSVLTEFDQERAAEHGVTGYAVVLESSDERFDAVV